MYNLNITFALLILLLPAGFCFGLESSWPDLSQPARTIGGGERDAAVVVGLENYFRVPGVNGARLNAKEWYEYLTQTRGVPPQNVKLLINEDGTREAILDQVRFAAKRVGVGGTLWFVFIGHGAPSVDGKDGLLVGVDAQQTAESLQTRSLSRSELLALLGQSKASGIHVILDACFSGRNPDGNPIVPGLQPLMVIDGSRIPRDTRLVVLTAAKGDQVAGPLPGTNRPAFSYLTLGGLRGWATQGRKNRITARALLQYATQALEATLRGRKQEPDIIGNEDTVLAISAGESAPDLRALAVTTSGGGAWTFDVSILPAATAVNAPKSLDAKSYGLDLSGMNLDELERLNAAFESDKTNIPAKKKAQIWREFANQVPRYAVLSSSRALQWDHYAVAEQARANVEILRDSDWSKLKRLLALNVVPIAEKQRWALSFFRTYGNNRESNPYYAHLVPYLPIGTVPEQAVTWIESNGRNFACPITFAQYNKCVEVGRCSPPHTNDGRCLVGGFIFSSHKNLSPQLSDANMPVVCVDWEQSTAFAAWIGAKVVDGDDYWSAVMKAADDLNSAPFAYWIMTGSGTSKKLASTTGAARTHGNTWETSEPRGDLTFCSVQERVSIH